jgi:hypothetical protein
MGDPENAYLIYGWEVDREELWKFIEHQKKEESEEDYDRWFEEGETIKFEETIFYIEDDYNDHYQPSEHRVFISLIKRTNSLNSMPDISNKTNVSKKLLKLLNKSYTSPKIYSILRVYE